MGEIREIFKKANAGGENINSKRNFIVNEVKSNYFPYSRAYEYASKILEMEDMFAAAASDKPLSWALLALNHALLFEGGVLEKNIFDFDYPISYFYMYLDFINDSRYNIIKFLGTLNLKKFLNTDINKELLIKKYGEESYDYIYEKTETIWHKTDKERAVKEYLSSEELYTYDYLRETGHIINEYGIKSAIPALEAIYVNNVRIPARNGRMSSIQDVFPIGELVAKYGSEKTKAYIYHQLLSEAKCDYFENFEKIVYLTNILEWKGAYDIELMCSVLRKDSIPIKLKALEIINKVPIYLRHYEIVQSIKFQILKQPYYLREKAVKVMSENAAFIGYEA